MVMGMVLILTPMATAVTIETVPVGNPGNAGEWSGESYGGHGPDRICGAVSYEFNMGTYEVTAGQYCEFLNAVAVTDTYGLYNTNMNYDLNPSMWGCNIKRSGTPGNYQYSVSSDWANRPVNYVSWGDAARFVNWLHNGQPTGAQDLTTTEEGSYCLNGAMTDEELIAVIRKGNATWVIPTEDEWYKAAYHKNDGVTSNYFDYPTGSDAVPGNGSIPDNGNNATFWDPIRGRTIGAPYYRTPSGEHENSDSPYGTFDQGGNVQEWTETILWAGNRGIKGGSFNAPVDRLLAARRGSVLPSGESDTSGFRVAEVPEPASLVILGFSGLGILLRRHK